MRKSVSSLVLMLVMATAALAAPAAYDVEDLGAVLPAAINGGGVVAGSITPPAGQQAVVVEPDGTLTVLGLGRANGIHGRRVVGYALLGLQTHAFVWTAPQGLRDLGTLGDPQWFSAANDVNARGVVVGYGERAVPGGGFERRAIRWVGTQPHDLGTPGGPEAVAVGINALGDIVGQTKTANLVWHAVLWPVGGVPVDLDTVGSTFSMAVAINRHREVVGWRQRAGGGQRGFRWTPATGMQDLAPLPGDTVSTADTLDDAGVIVGQSIFEPPHCCQVVFRAVRWVDGVVEDLNTLVTAPGWVLQRAVGINHAGQIAGAGTYQGQARGFLLTPVPQGRSRTREFVHDLEQRLAQERHARR